MKKLHKKKSKNPVCVVWRSSVHGIWGGDDVTLAIDFFINKKNQQLQQSNRLLQKIEITFFPLALLATTFLLLLRVDFFSFCPSGLALNSFFNLIDSEIFCCF